MFGAVVVVDKMPKLNVFEKTEAWKMNKKFILNLKMN